MHRIGAAGWTRHCGDLWREAALAAGAGDICATLGPSPRSRRDYAAMLRKHGARCLFDLACLLHGPAQSPTRARRGDLVAFGTGALGVARGEAATFVDGSAIPLPVCTASWPLRAATGNVPD